MIIFALLSLALLLGVIIFLESLLFDDSLIKKIINTIIKTRKKLYFKILYFRINHRLMPKYEFSKFYNFPAMIKFFEMKDYIDCWNLLGGARVIAHYQDLDDL